MIRLEYLPADIHGLSSLARNTLSGRQRLPGVAVPRTLSGISQPEERFVPDERQHLSKWLEAQLSPLGAHIHVLDSVRALAQSGTSCVVTAAAPAFMCAPLQAIFRAVQVVRLSDLLSDALKYATPKADSCNKTNVKRCTQTINELVEHVSSHMISTQYKVFRWGHISQEN